MILIADCIVSRAMRKHAPQLDEAFYDNSGRPDGHRLTHARFAHPAGHSRDMPAGTSNVEPGRRVHAPRDGTAAHASHKADASDTQTTTD